MSDDDLLARILQDAETTTIADALGLEPADYAARVLHYIRNPNAEPQLEVMDAVAEKEAGMPSQADCVTFLQKLDSGEIPLDEHDVSAFTGFNDDEKSAATLTGGRRPGQQAPPPMPAVPGEAPAADDGKKSRSGRG